MAWLLVRGKELAHVENSINRIPNCFLDILFGLDPSSENQNNGFVLCRIVQE